MSEQQLEQVDVRVEVTVEAPVEQAFTVFAERMQDWWPVFYKLGDADRVDVRVEPKVGGRWHEVGADGSEQTWGQVLAWDAPGHAALSWQITPDFTAEPDEQRASRVDFHFTGDGPDRTTVTVVHSELQRHGDRWESVRDSVAAEGGWPGVMQGYVALVHGDTR